jgi:hypothetical protein
MHRRRFRIWFCGLGPRQPALRRCQRGSESHVPGRPDRKEGRSDQQYDSNWMVGKMITGEQDTP